MNKKTIRDIDVNEKRVLVRCDFNVPQDLETGEITDNRRIVAALPTIKYLLEHNAKVILCSHLGRPKGEFNEKYSLNIVAKELEKLLNKKVELAKDVVGESAKSLTENMQNGDIVLLENVRFEAGEEKNDEELSKKFASLAEIFVNDAFGTAHRAHSSTAGVADFLPAVSGFLIEKEIEFLGKALENPQKPFIAILGGAKVSDKIAVIDNLLEKVDKLIIGGAMAFTFLKAQGHKIGKSLCEEDKLDVANEILEKAQQKGIEILLPLDSHVATDYSNDCEDKIVHSKEIPDEFEGLDIGPDTIELFGNVLKDAKTIIWNGPLGVCEFSKFEVGTKSIAQILADLDAITIVGGGDSAAAIEKMGLAERFTHISTGGGASLEFLEGKKLPGIECLLDK